MSLSGELKSNKEVVNNNTYLIKAAETSKSPKGTPYVRLKLEKNGQVLEALLPGHDTVDELIGKAATLTLDKKGTVLVANGFKVVA